MAASGDATERSTPGLEGTGTLARQRSFLAALTLCSLVYLGLFFLLFALASGAFDDPDRSVLPTHLRVYGAPLLPLAERGLLEGLSDREEWLALFAQAPLVAFLPAHLWAPWRAQQPGAAPAPTIAPRPAPPPARSQRPGPDDS